MTGEIPDSWKIAVLNVSNVSDSPDGKSDGEEYNIPHWINLSFYTSSKVISYSAFVPRIKLPTPDGSPMRGALSGPLARSKRLMTPTYDGTDSLLSPSDPNGSFGASSIHIKSTRFIKNW